jgi:hypothetical protein
VVSAALLSFCGNNWLKSTTLVDSGRCHVQGNLRGLFRISGLGLGKSSAIAPRTRRL